MSIPSFNEWLNMVSGPALGSVVAVALAFIIEYWDKYQELPPRLKALSYLGLCLAIGVGSACLRALLGFEVWSFDPLIWHALWNAFGVFGVGTAAHEFLPRWKRGT